MSEVKHRKVNLPGGKVIEFVHNLGDFCFADLNGLINSWLTIREIDGKPMTRKSLCDYIMSKNHLYVAMSEDEYERLRFGSK